MMCPTFLFVICRGGFHICPFISGAYGMLPYESLTPQGLLACLFDSNRNSNMSPQQPAVVATTGL